MERENGRTASKPKGQRWLLSGATVAVLLGISIAFVGAPDAEPDPDDAIAGFVDGAPEPVTETPDPPPDDIEPGPPEHEHGTMYPSDDGAWEYEDLNEREQAHAERAQEWAETANGTEVHNAFSAAAATTTTLRLVDEAQQASGLEGIETLGVQ